MTETTQDAILQFLRTNASHGPSVADAVIQTHAALVFLHADEAMKIKRAVRYDYLDASTLDSREAMLRRELELNAPAAPGLYRDVVPITRDADGAFRLGGAGEPVEWVLRMTRFPAEAELSDMADRGRIDSAMAEALGAAIARYHAAAPVADLPGSVLIAEIIDELDRVLADLADQVGPDRVRRFLDAARDAHRATAPLLDARTGAAWVRRCHGDLHLRNLILWNGVPTPFDALEFDERLGTCDVLYDLAFLLMDLSHRCLDGPANRVLNVYLHAAASADHLRALAAMPLFLSVRAAIRAMVEVQTAAFQDDPAPLIEDGAHFLDQANAYLERHACCLVAIGGLSGSGKTTVAKRIAPALGAFPGALHLRSDLERKALFGVEPTTRLPVEAYDSATTARVYEAMRAKARLALAAGHSVILDAAHHDPEERAQAERLAQEARCPFCGLWLEADTETRVDRVNTRKQGASDADAAVARQQSALHTGAIGWHRVQTTGTAEGAVSEAHRAIEDCNTRASERMP
ncbi:MAG: AAA family ATPase [Pseudomonadota bacterium]